MESPLSYITVLQNKRTQELLASAMMPTCNDHQRQTHMHFVHDSFRQTVLKQSINELDRLMASRASLHESDLCSNAIVPPAISSKGPPRHEAVATFKTLAQHHSNQHQMKTRALKKAMLEQMEMAGKTPVDTEHLRRIQQICAPRRVAMKLEMLHSEQRLREALKDRAATYQAERKQLAAREQTRMRSRGRGSTSAEQRPAANLAVQPRALYKLNRPSSAGASERLALPRHTNDLGPSR
mmetsp:Transcript_1379/g.2686  ORF Transcript_1379/g.2686 Transcript_1379/m.2686 type:complete len:239 (-) Transcript_1379:140-856(-)